MEILCMGCMKKYDDREGKCPFCGYVPGTPPLEACHIVPGTVLEERYIVGRVLGFGGFGVTYLGYDRVLEKAVAIKEYLPGEFSTRMPNQVRLTVYPGEKREQFDSGKSKFLDESRKLVKFQNVPEVIHVFDCFEDNNTAYIIMEYLDGESLKQRLERVERMTVEEALPIIMDVLHALEAVHQKGILHRDVAPDNIYLTRDGAVKLLDFGAARFATTTHSRSLTVLIKPGYAPEEQYRSRGDQGPWTDVYATAATFYKMITGVTPEDALERAAKDTLQPPSKLGVKIDPDVETALLNALNIKVDGRTRTALNFEKELTSKDVKRVVVRKEKRQDFGQWPLWSRVLAAAGLAVLLAFIVLIGGSRKKLQKTEIAGTTLSADTARVPNLVNEEMESAVTRGQDANLTVQVYDKQYSDRIPADRVLSQTVKGGSLVDRDSVLGIVISAGIEKTRVPNVVGMTSEEAEAKLKEAGLVVTKTEKEYRAAPGTVGEQSIAADTETDTGTKIEIVISKGISGGDSSKTETVDDLTGVDFDQASGQMIAKYLYLIKSGTEYSDTAAAGAIISQDPAAGTTVNENSNIRVTVSLGKEQMTVPDVQYKTQDEAAALLAQNQLTADFRDEASDSVQAGNVIRQETPAGQQVDKGTAIVVYLSTGAPAAAQPQQPVTNGAVKQPQQNNAGGQTAARTQAAARKQETPAQTPAPTEARTAAPETPAASKNAIWDIIGD